MKWAGPALATCYLFSETMFGVPVMLCPHCKVALRIADRQGVEIDYCPTCRGVWLDRGELDKILERSVAAAASALAGFGPPPHGDWQHDDDDDDDRRRHFRQPGDGQPGHDQADPRQGNRHRRESWLGDLFDFG